MRLEFGDFHGKDSTDRITIKRFIPAGAGNTKIQRSVKTKPPVHPCGRREHRGKGLGDICSAGSSLRAQGTPAQNQ